MRTQFYARLDKLTGQLLEMCLLAREAVSQATDSLVHTDALSAGIAIDHCERVDAQREPSERLAVALLALETPVATELRRVVSAIQMVGDLARMGGLARHVADVSRRRHPRALPAEILPTVARIGQVTVELIGAAGEVLQTADPERSAALEDQDDILDDLHAALLDALASPDWTGDTATVVDVTLLGRYYERIGDHAVQVGRRMIFVATGSPAPDYTRTMRHRPGDA